MDENTLLVLQPDEEPAVPEPVKTSPTSRQYWLAALKHLNLKAVLACLILSVLATPAYVPPPWHWANLGMVVGAVLLTALVIHVLYVAFPREKLYESRRQFEKKALLYGVLILLMVWVSRGVEIVAEALLQEEIMSFGVPLTVGPLLASLFFGPAAGRILTLAGCCLACLVWDNLMGVFLYYLLTGLLAVHLVQSSQNLVNLIKAGVLAGCAGIIFLFNLALLQGWLLDARFALTLTASLSASVMSGLLAVGLTPLIEMVFGLTSHIRLREMASLDHPLLRRLMLEAPGTYHHSLLTSSLVEAAARQIGADHLLARTGALYHDLGKIKKPDYFIENLRQGPNKHDKLAPSMSALILTSHVKEGVDMARKAKLAEPIINIIAQHHGTRVISYFYNKAVEACRAQGQPDPDMDNFRYPGPKPQSKEAALVMMADTIEAASRSLENPTPSRLQSLVQQQVNQIFAEGQLSDCNLTLKDINQVAKIFITILNGIFHHRVKYAAAPDEKNHAHSHKPVNGKNGPKPEGTDHQNGEGA